jgi:hypothetical protein
MNALLDQVVTPPRRQPPIGQSLIAEGHLTTADVDELLGWQWLLAELGEARRLGDLAVAAGLLPAPPPDP